MQASLILSEEIVTHICLVLENESYLQAPSVITSSTEKADNRIITSRSFLITITLT